MLNLIPKRAGALVKLPNDLVRYSVGVAEMFVRTALVERAALTEDSAFLEGTGGTLVPLGILSYPRSAASDTPTADKLTVHPGGSVGVNGDTFLPEDVLKMMALVEEANDPDGANAWIMRPLFFAGLANLRADAVNAGDRKGPFLFPIMGAAIGKQLAGLPVRTSTQASNTRAKGSASNLGYVLCGNFRRALIGRVGVIELAVSTDAGFAADQVQLRAIIRVDFGLTHAQSFCISDTLVFPA
jgi:HK97 family phage major capsid protein